MIVDKIDNMSMYSSLFPQIGEIYNYIVDSEHNIKEGILEANQIKYFHVSNEENKDMLFECHKNNIDVVYIISGQETMGVVSRGDATVISPLKDDKEMLCCNEDFSILHLQTGMFVILYPGEAHCPAMNKSNKGNFVEKIVFKISIV